jgi:hypothetical protein
MVKLVLDNGVSYEGILHGGEYERITDKDRFLGGGYAVNLRLDVEILPPEDFEIFKSLLKKENPKIVLKEWEA